MQKLEVSTDLSGDTGHSPKEHLALRFAEFVTRDSNRVPDEFFIKLKTAFTGSEIVELTFLIGFITMLNRFNNALQIQYHGEFKDVQVH
jgi:alkylhydroperoxidase family enzyme